jgi:hypothetical protein
LLGVANYHNWFSIAKIFIDIMGVRDITIGKTPKASVTDATAKSSWFRLLQLAEGFLLLNIDRV